MTKSTNEVRTNVKASLNVLQQYEVIFTFLNGNSTQQVNVSVKNCTKIQPLNKQYVQVVHSIPCLYVLIINFVSYEFGGTKWKCDCVQMTALMLWLC